MKKDQDLIDDILLGNPRERSHALKCICDSCFPKVKSYVSNNGGDLVLAQDIFQDGITILYQNLRLQKFRYDSAIDTYLFGICKNLWLKEVKRRNRQDLKLKLLKADDFIESSSTINIELLHITLAEIKNDCKVLLIGFYYHKKSIMQLRYELNMKTDQVVKNKKARCLKHLFNVIEKKRLKKEMFFND